MANFINDCAGNNLVHASISENCHACFNTCQKIGFNLENQTTGVLRYCTLLVKQEILK